MHVPLEDCRVAARTFRAASLGLPKTWEKLASAHYQSPRFFELAEMRSNGDNPRVLHGHLQTLSLDFMIEENPTYERFIDSQYVLEDVGDARKGLRFDIGMKQKRGSKTRFGEVRSAEVLNDRYIMERAGEISKSHRDFNLYFFAIAWTQKAVGLLSLTGDRLFTFGTKRNKPVVQEVVWKNH